MASFNIAKNSVLRRSGIFMAAALTLAGMALVSPQPAKAAGPMFASVDLALVFNKSNDKAKADIELQKLGQGLQTAFQSQQQGVMLSNTELRTLGQISQKAVQTDSDKASIQQLLAKSKKDADELAALQQKKESDLTEADKLRLSTLTAQQQAGQQALSDLNGEYRQILDQKSQELNAQINAHMKEVISQVAVKQGISVVFDSTVAVYTAADISKDVLAQLNK
ncbi:MAG TPA: OmpH family outer membrane protein [Capsulimonadaceae bacterium]